VSTEPVRTAIVDDDFRVAAVHAAYVARTEGYSVVGQAHSGAEAMDLVQEQRPDLVLMDVYLPDRNGLDVVRTMLDLVPHPDIIVVTAAREVGTVRAAMQLGAVHYLVKPFGYAALAERLQAYRRLRARLSGLPAEADQADVDALFSLLRRPAQTTAQPEKGHSALTLELVRKSVLAAERDVSATDVAGVTGLSRATAQRYLNYLERLGFVRMQLQYGTTGRPEHRYLAVLP